MCELLALSANTPTDICFSFKGFMPRGGEIGPHGDGWGIGFYEGKAVRSFLDVTSASTSALAMFLAENPIKSESIICHIRQANVGHVNLENTHPFVREVWGRHWLFAHNGQMPEVKKWKLRYYQPVGTTDSEHAFCWLLDEILSNFDQPPVIGMAFYRFLHSRMLMLSALGVCNIILSDSERIYAFCTTKLQWIQRKAPFGLTQLKDQDVKVDFSTQTTNNDKVVVIATEPLTDHETWTSLSTGQLAVFEKGEQISLFDAHP